jgi:hypothetical protein
MARERRVERLNEHALVGGFCARSQPQELFTLDAAHVGYQNHLGRVRTSFRISGRISCEMEDCRPAGDEPL